jgi:hypothetical protein
MDLEDRFEFIPESLLSLYGDILYDKLTKNQKRGFSKLEIAQVMYSYAWSEGLACLFFFKYASSLDNITSLEYQYILKEAEEECRHQQMFSMAIRKLEVEPIQPRLLHRFAAWFATRLLPPDIMFMSVMAIELVTDVYGRELVKQANIYPVLSKISELHSIEEVRHIYFTQLLLERYTKNAGLLRRTTYSIVICLNIYFMRTLYVRKEIFEKIGLDPKIYYKSAYNGLKDKFSEHCLEKAKKFVFEWNGFNWLTRIFWKKLLNAKF